MTTNDAPRPALDAALLGQLRWAVEQLRGVRYRAEGDYFRAETIILNNADALLVAAAERDALAGENARLRAALGKIVGIGVRPTFDSAAESERIAAIARAALAPAEGAGGDDGAR